MLALISPEENNRICQIEQTEFPVALPLFWIDCPNYITTEWTYADGTFVEPSISKPNVIAEPTKNELLAELQALSAKIEALT